MNGSPPEGGHPGDEHRHQTPGQRAGLQIGQSDAGYGTYIVRPNRFPGREMGSFPLQAHTVLFEIIGGLGPNGFTPDSWFSSENGTIAIYFSNDAGEFDDRL